MGWITLSLRRSELQASISDMQMELIKISNKRNRLHSFSNSIADGNIAPSEISSVGTELFGDALDFMGYSNDAAAEAADIQTSLYEERYGQVTQEQYYNNPGLASQAELYFDESGNLNLEAIRGDLYEEALKDYVDTVIAPKINELEKEMEAKQTKIETELQNKEAELQVVKESIGKNIQSSTIKL